MFKIYNNYIIIKNNKIDVRNLFFYFNKYFKLYISTNKYMLINNKI